MHSSSPAFSLIGEKLTARSGILELMDDLGRAMTVEPDMRMRGGGNPAAVPAMQQIIRERMVELLGEGDAFERMIGNYDPPQGNPRFLRAMAELLQRNFGWNVGPQNLAITCGGQTAFFYLFNLLAGQFGDGRKRKVLLPLSPEYIGYADQGLEERLFVACRPRITWPKGETAHEFKYVIDFAAVEAALQKEDIAMMAVSRPTNPTGNVLTDAEVQHLAALAEKHGIPLVIDNAYGAPFPNVIFTEAKPFYAAQVILTMSLSKLGLPGTRTAIVVAPEKIATALGAMTAIAGLANGNVGQQLALPWIESDRILQFGSQILRPFYAERSAQAQAWTREFFNAAGVNWALHASEGAFFHWLWLPDLKISTRELYERLKRRKVLVVPGEYFFFGLDGDWPHSRQCLRLNYSGNADAVREGLLVIAEEARAACYAWGCSGWRRGDFWPSYGGVQVSGGGWEEGTTVVVGRAGLTKQACTPKGGDILLCRRGPDPFPPHVDSEGASGRFGRTPGLPCWRCYFCSCSEVGCNFAVGKSSWSKRLSRSATFSVRAENAVFSPASSRSSGTPCHRPVRPRVVRQTGAQRTGIAHRHHKAARSRSGTSRRTAAAGFQTVARRRSGRPVHRSRRTIHPWSGSLRCLHAGAWCC